MTDNVEDAAKREEQALQDVSANASPGPGIL